MKYYVKMGNYQHLVHTGNPYAACVKTFQKYILDGDKQSIPTFFSVSQKGFTEHDDNEIIGTDMIIKLMQMSNLAKKQLKKLAKKDKKDSQQS